VRSRRMRSGVGSDWGPDAKWSWMRSKAGCTDRKGVSGHSDAAWIAGATGARGQGSAPRRRMTGTAPQRRTDPPRSTHSTNANRSTNANHDGQSPHASLAPHASRAVLDAHLSHSILIPSLQIPPLAIPNLEERYPLTQLRMGFGELSEAGKGSFLADGGGGSG
jgi:hypothetical protein